MPMRTPTRKVVGGLLGVAVLTLGVACKGGMAKIEAIRDALEKDDAAEIKSAVDGFPACPDAPPVALGPKQASPRDTACLAEIATALGSKKGFVNAPPDQAAATTAAIVILRDGRGDYVAHSEIWLGSLKAGKGTGIDALRLAVAHAMAAAAPKVGRPLESDKDAREALKAIAGAIPGACPTYWLLGTGTDPSKIPAELSAEHATCVHRDLARREGPGGGYGDGTFRALEGSLALWRETERALRLGLPHAAPGAKSAVEAKLKTIEGATQAVVTKKIASTETSQVLTFMGEVHADAGIMLWKDAGAKDAAAEGGSDAGPDAKK